MGIEGWSGSHGKRGSTPTDLEPIVEESSDGDADDSSRPAGRLRTVFLGVIAAATLAVAFFQYQQAQLAAREDCRQRAQLELSFEMTAAQIRAIADGCGGTPLGLSSTEPRVTVPDIVGRSLRDGLLELARLELAGITREGDDADPGAIIRAQDPPAESMVSRRSVVSLRTR